MNGLVAARGPARAARDEGGVIAPTDQQLTTDGLLLIVALQAKGLVAGAEHLVVHRAVRIVAGDAALAGGFMFEDVRALLRRVALDAGVIHVRDLGAAAADRVPVVRIMAVGAGDFTRGDRVGGRKMKFAALVQVALKTRFGRGERVDDRSGATAGLDVKAARAMAGFAPDVLGIVALSEQARMCCGGEPAGDVSVAVLAFA